MQENEKQLREEYAREEAQEYEETKYDVWLSENIDELRARFIEDNYEEEFHNFCKQDFADCEEADDRNYQR